MLFLGASPIVREAQKLAKRKTGSTDKDLYLSKPRLTTRGVENIALLEEPSVNQIDSERLDLPNDQENDDNQVEGDVNVDNDVGLLGSINRNNINPN